MPGLVVSQNAEDVQVLAQLLQKRKIEIEACESYEVARAHAGEQRFAGIIVDCANETEALELVASIRSGSVNSATLIVAIVEPEHETRELFERGVNFVMYKPITAERADESLKAAWSLLPQERRKSERTHVSTQASITFATTEDAPVPLLNVSEDGIAIHSQDKMPPPCRVYFQFTLPDQPGAVKLAAEVIWQDWRGRVGLHFAHVPKASRRILNEWLGKNPKHRGETREPAAPRLERFVLSSPEARISVPAEAVPSEDERRAQARRACRLGVNVYRPEGSVLQHCTLTDVSAGGCYIETTVPLTVGTRLVIEVRTQDWKLRVHGKVRSTHLGFGMGVEFRKKTAEDKDQLQQLLKCLDAQVKSLAGSK